VPPDIQEIVDSASTTTPRASAPTATSGSMEPDAVDAGGSRLLGLWRRAWTRLIPDRYEGRCGRGGGQLRNRPERGYRRGVGTSGRPRVQAWRRSWRSGSARCKGRMVGAPV